MSVQTNADCPGHKTPSMLPEKATQKGPLDLWPGSSLSFWVIFSNQGYSEHRYYDGWLHSASSLPGEETSSSHTLLSASCTSFLPRTENQPNGRSYLCSPDKYITVTCSPWVKKALLSVYLYFARWYTIHENFLALHVSASDLQASFPGIDTIVTQISCSSRTSSVMCQRLCCRIYILTNPQSNLQMQNLSCDMTCLR
jgi:hypothetical protein